MLPRRWEGLESRAPLKGSIVIQVFGFRVSAFYFGVQKLYIRKKVRSKFHTTALAFVLNLLDLVSKSKIVWRNWNRGREGRFRKVAGWGDAGFPPETVVLFVASVVGFICEAVL